MSRSPSAKASDQALVLAQRGRIGEACDLLEHAVAGGDGQAAMTLADWRLSGELIRRDLALARDLFGKAARLGVDEAEPIYLAMLANGAGGVVRAWSEAIDLMRARARSDPLASRQSKLVSAMELDQAGNPSSLPEALVLRETPRIAVRRGFMTSEECRYLTERALPMLQPAIVIDSRTGRPIRDPVRTADSAGFPFVLEDPAIHALNRRIMAATDTCYEQGEPIQVLSYQPGQEYKLHSDCLPPGSNQRVQTFLVALTDNFEGGETSFPRIGLDIRVNAGDAIHFQNVDGLGQPEPLAWHAGLPVRSGRKLLLSKWIREAPLDLSGPPGRLF